MVGTEKKERKKELVLLKSANSCECTGTATITWHYLTKTVYVIQNKDLVG